MKDVVFREIDRIKVKGKDEAVTIYEPIAFESEIDRALRDELTLWDSALAAYRARNWDRAAANLADLRRLNPTCGLYGRYADKVAGFRRTPPPSDWDGVTAFDEK